MTVRGWKLVVEYDGRAFHGWQRQRPGVRTVQGELERAVATMAGQPTLVRGAGRTDAGVHALGQVAGFRTESRIPARGWKLGLNTLLAADVSVRSAQEVDPSFDPRRDARGKHYRYVLWHAPVPSALRTARAWHVYAPLDLGRMQRAAATFVGEHDFSAFRSADCDRKTTVRVVRRCTVSEQPSESADGREIRIDVEATAFLQNMARIMVGTLVEIGRGKMQPEAIDALFASRDRTAAGMTAPPGGLYLVEVYYE